MLTYLTHDKFIQLLLDLQNVIKYKSLIFRIYSDLEDYYEKFTLTMVTVRSKHSNDKRYLHLKVGNCTYVLALVENADLTAFSVNEDGVYRRLTLTEELEYRPRE